MLLLLGNHMILIIFSIQLELLKLVFQATFRESNKKQFVISLVKISVLKVDVEKPQSFSSQNKNYAILYSLLIQRLVVGKISGEASGVFPNHLNRAIIHQTL